MISRLLLIAFSAHCIISLAFIWGWKSWVLYCWFNLSTTSWRSYMFIVLILLYIYICNLKKSGNINLMNKLREILPNRYFCLENRLLRLGCLEPALTWVEKLESLLFLQNFIYKCGLCWLTCVQMRNILLLLVWSMILIQVMAFWLSRVNKWAILLDFILFFAIFLDDIDDFFLYLFGLQGFILFLQSFLKTFLISQRSLILFHKYSLFLHLLLGLIDNCMSVCFKIIAIFVPYVRYSWYGAYSWKQFMWTYPLCCLLFAFLDCFMVIVNRRRCEKWFVAVESLNITLEEILSRIAF